MSEGKVYVATFSNQLVVYGLKASGAYDLRLSPVSGMRSKLTTNSLPRSVAPRQIVAVSVVAENEGPTAWHVADSIRLTSRFIPDLERQIVEGARALALPSDVEPHQSVTFSYHLHVPVEEGLYYYKWQLGTAERTGETEFGRATPEWRFSVLRLDCADLRQQGEVATAELPKIEAGMEIPPELAQRLQSIADEAKRRRCRLTMGTMDMIRKSAHPQ